MSNSFFTIQIDFEEKEPPILKLPSLDFTNIEILTQTQNLSEDKPLQSLMHIIQIEKSKQSSPNLAQELPKLPSFNILHPNAGNVNFPPPSGIDLSSSESNKIFSNQIPKIDYSGVIPPSSFNGYPSQVPEISPQVPRMAFFQESTQQQSSFLQNPFFR